MFGINFGFKKLINSNGSVIPDGYDILILFGQSNGYFGTTTDGTDVYPTGVYQLGNWLGDVGVIIPATEPIDQYNTRSLGASGPMRTFVDNYLANITIPPNRNLLIISGALSGTGFFDNRWNKGDDLYEALLTRCLSMLVLPGSQLKGIFSQMGERDSESTPDLWQSKSTAMVVNFKKDLGYNYSHTPVVFGGMLPSWAASSAPRIAVDARMKLIGTYIENSAFASADMPTVLTEHTGDGLHYNVVSQRELGNRYWTAFQTALTNDFARSVSDAVSDLAVTAKPSYDMQLDWTMPLNAYPYVDSYNVYYKLTGAGSYTFFENTTTLQSTITGLSATTEYQFMVRAVNFIGESLNSNIITATTELNPITYTHAFRFAFENDLDNGIGGFGTGYGTINYTNDGTRGNVYGTGLGNAGVKTGVEIPANSDFTKCAWIKNPSASLNHIMSSGDAAGTSLMVQSSKVRVGTFANFYAISQSDTLAAGWNHIVITYNATTDLLTLYVNKVSKGTATLADAGTHTIYVAGRNTELTGWLGLLDDARLFLRVLNTSEINQVYDGDII